jgi:hypothetical protein
MSILMISELSYEANSKVWVEAMCVHCNKRFTSMRSVSMHLKGTANRHAVNFVNRGKYDKKTGLREKSRPELNFTLSDK